MTPENQTEQQATVIEKSDEVRSQSQNSPIAKSATAFNFANKGIYRLQLPSDNRNIKKLAQKSPVPKYEDKSPIDVGRLEQRDKKSVPGAKKTPKSMKSLKSSLKSVLTDNSLDDRIYSPISQEVETVNNTSKNKEKNPESPNRASDIEDKSLTTENQQHSVGPHTSSNKPPLFQLSIGQKDSKNDILRKL